MGVSHGPCFLLLRWHMVASHRMSAESWGLPAHAPPSTMITHIPLQRRA